MSNERPGSSSAASAVDPQMPHAEIVTLIERRDRAYNDHDVDALMADYADECVVDSPSAGTHRGPRAVGDVFQELFDAFPDMRLRTERLVIDGCQVAQLVSVEGTDLGEFLGLPATGRSFSLPAVFFFELRNRRIVREQRVYDFTGLLVQIGVLKAKPL
jgi:steroid delta-isomerase-like uncharacterized protein